MNVVPSIVNLLAVVGGVAAVLLVPFAVFANTEAAREQALNAIRWECEHYGCTVIGVSAESRTNYSVRYRKNGRSYRGECTVNPFGRKVSWQKDGPAGPHDV